MPAVPSIQQLVNVEHINPEDLQYNILQINRAGLANKLEAKNFQLTMLVLLMIDCFFIFLELLFLYKVIDTKNGEAYGSLLHKFCVCILFFFLLESLMLIYCFAFRFFKHFWYTLDLIIVLISLVFDLLIKVDSASLIMVVRLWRVIRIIHGVSATRHELKHMAAKEKAKNESLIEDLEARENMIKSKLARLESSSTGENLTLVLEMKKDMESMEEKLHEFIDREKQLMEENEALRERLISLAPTPISCGVPPSSPPHLVTSLLSKILCRASLRPSTDSAVLHPPFLLAVTTSLLPSRTRPSPGPSRMRRAARSRTNHHA